MSNENKVSAPDERASFEAWADARKEDSIYLPKFSDGTYIYDDTHAAWAAWQARAALAATPAVVNASETPNSSTIAVPSGWKLVPDDATPEWVENLEALPDWRDAVGECIKKFLAASPVAPQAAPAAVAVSFELLKRAVNSLGSFVGDEGWAQTDMDTMDDLSAFLSRAALAATPAAAIGNPISKQNQHVAAPVVPNGWVPCVVTYEGQHPEEVAYGPQVMMDRLKKWLERYFKLKAAAPLVLPEPDINTANHVGIRVVGYTEQQVRALLATATGLPAQAVLDYPWRERLLDGRELVRDQQGFAEHPELPLLDEGMKPRAFFAALGVEMKHTMADDDLSMDEYDAMSDAENWSAWMPRPPIGDAWNLVAIFDTEDGPAAWWARAQKESQEAEPQAQIDAQDAESDYQRGYRHGYNRRDAEVQGALL